MSENMNKNERERLFYKQKNVSDIIGEEEFAAAIEYGERYKTYLKNAKTEREAVAECIKLAEAKGFKSLVPGMPLKSGDKVYKSVRSKAIMLAVIGQKPLSEGAIIAAAHVDAPRLDLKQVPMYEDSEIAFFKTHYYGGIRKYQWVAIPLALHGTVVLKDGTVKNIKIGEEENEPSFVITDLLPHLAKEQSKRPLSEAITGEALNIVIGSIPEKDDDGNDRVKFHILKILNSKYGITEEDFLSAEFEAVPALPVKDIGFDNSLIGAYGHDDRVCAYAELEAILDVDVPSKTAICILADKEEIGSEGVSGMKSAAFETFVEDLCESQGASVRRCFENSFCISADVTNAFDPTYPEVSDKRNNAKLNYGIAMAKFTGARGKSGSSDASAEVVGTIRKVFSDNNVVWQMGELGKVDEGGGGTVAMYMAARNIDTIDAGVPVLSMHSPYEVVSKLDCWMTYKGILAMFNSQ